MPFDPTQPPTGGSPPESEPIRENFIQLSIHHKGATAPPAATPGFIWWDTSTPENEVLRALNDTEWVILFEHMESTPVPAGGGGGGSFTRGVLTGSFDQVAQHVNDFHNVSGFPNDAIVTGLIIWPSPIGGGQYTAQTSYSQALAVIPKDALASSDGSNIVRSWFGSTTILGTNAVALKEVAAQGSTSILTDTGVNNNQAHPAIAIYDGTDFEFHNFLHSVNTAVPNFDEQYYLLEPIAKVGGFTTADYCVPVHAIQVSISDLDDSGELHLATMNMGAVAAHKINYRVEYLYMA